MIDATFENLVNSSFQQQHPLADTLYRANCIHGLFSMLPRFNDLKLTKLYETDPITVDLNQQVDINNIKLIIPNSVVGVDKQVCVVLFWLAKFDNLVMNVTDTIWGNPSKIILPRCRKDQDIVTWYDPNIGDWRFSLPVNASSPDGVQLPCSILDNGNNWYTGIVNGTYTGDVDKSSVLTTATPSGALTANIPFIWGNLDSMQFNGSYEGV
jgi:hypothetical protein